MGMHPLQPHIIVTASLDRTMKLWDFRRMVKSENGPHPAILAEYTCPLSVSSAYINSRGTALATSYDDTIKIFDLPNLKGWRNDVPEEIQPTNVVRHNNQTGRWLTVFKAQWHQNPESGNEKFTIGNMNRGIDVYSAKGDTLLQFRDERITAVPAVVKFHPTQDWIIAGNASGKAYFLS